MIVGSLLLILVAVALLGIGLARGSNVLLIGSIAASLFAAIALIVGARQAAAGRVDEDGEPTELPDPRRGGDEYDQLEFAELDGEMEYPGARTRPRAATGIAGQNRPTEPLNREPLARGPLLDGGLEPSRPDLVGAGVSSAGFSAPAYSGAGAPGAAAGDGLGAEPLGVATARATALDEYDDETDEDPPDEPGAQLVSAADAARVARMSSDVLVIDGRPRYHIPGCVHLLGRESEPLPVAEAVELGFTPCSLCEPDSALLAEARRV